MHCTACKLEYPKHLNFCRRCGQPLVSSAGERTADAVCCTRCGARVLRGENFCQHCGSRMGIATQETVIGACCNCGTYWRSTWHFCKRCGLDLEQALQFGGVAQPAASRLTSEISQHELSLDGPTITCPRCAAEAQPYSLFCERCGGELPADEDEPAAESVSAELPSDLPEAAVFVPVIEEPPLPPAVRGASAEAATPYALPKKAAGSERFSFETRDSFATLDAAQLEATEAPAKDLAAPLADAPDAQENGGPLPGSRITLAFPSQPLSAKSGKLGKSGRLGAAAEHNGAQAEESEEPLQEAAQVIPISAPSKSAEPIVRPVAVPLPPRSVVIPDRGLDELESTAARPLTGREVWKIAAVLVGLVLLVGWVAYGLLGRTETGEQADGTGPLAAASPRLAEPGNSPAPEPAAAAPKGMVYVPGGVLLMGREDGDRYERPTRYVEVKPFYIDRTEVTNQEYQAFVEATGANSPSHWRGPRIPNGEAHFPVVNVSWPDARTYAQWAGKRLPTEEEWEYAARGSDGRLYPWGQEWNPDFANTVEGGGKRIVEVGRYKGGASPFGVLDLCGNVWEWTASNPLSYADLLPLMHDGKQVSGKVIRGGAFDAERDHATATYRGVVQPEKAYPKTGFRCVRGLE